MFNLKIWKKININSVGRKIWNESPIPIYNTKILNLISNIKEVAMLEIPLPAISAHKKAMCELCYKEDKSVKVCVVCIQEVIDYEILSYEKKISESLMRPVSTYEDHCKFDDLVVIKHQLMAFLASHRMHETIKLITPYFTKIERILIA